MATKLKKSVTVDDILAWGPCPAYSDNDGAAIRKIFGNRKRINVMDAPKYVEAGVPVQDVLWILLHPEIIGERECHLFACHEAEIALRRERKQGREPDKRSWNGIAVKRKWLDGKATDEELASAREAAREAAWAAARAAGAAAREAAGASAREAAWAAAWEAGAAARAAWAAAWEAGAAARAAGASAREAAGGTTETESYRRQFSAVMRILERVHQVEK